MTINLDRFGRISDLIYDELSSATKKFDSFKSIHEGYAIIHEELDELWDNVKLQHPDPEDLKKEAKQVAAMAIRFLYDLCDV